jgi:hypothetical protein
VINRIIPGLAFSLLLVSSGFAQSGLPPTSLEREASAGGTVRLRLSAGGYRIRASRDNKIRVRWETRWPDELASVRVDVEVRGKEARIRTRGPSNNFQVEIEIPAASDVYARLTAGELSIEGIEGSKDIESHAGDLAIDVGRPESYGRVDASVLAGDLDAAAFRISKGGLWRSFTWHGGGNYRLHAHVGAGELRLYSRTPI